MSKREDLLELIKILDNTNRHKDMLVHMNEVIDINPELSAEERNLLSVSYKNTIDVIRTNIHSLTLCLQDSKDHPNTIPYIQNSRLELKEELKKYCNELIQLVDEKLLPVSESDKAAKIFYLKLKGDYCRYMCEALEGEEKDEIAAKAEENYKAAIKLADEEIQSYSPISLGIYLNYTVFLYETVSRKDEALKLAEEVFAKNCPNIEQNDESEVNDAKMILTLLEDNINLWKQQIPAQAE